MIKTLIGAAILLSVFGGLFYAVARVEGFLTTAWIFAGAIGTTFLIVLAISLLQR